MQNIKSTWGGKREGAGRPTSPETKIITFRVDLRAENTVRRAVKIAVAKAAKGFNKVVIAIIVIALLTSCSPGRWVGGNAKHFQQRKDAKELREAKLNL